MIRNEEEKLRKDMLLLEEMGNQLARIPERERQFTLGRILGYTTALIESAKLIERRETA